MQYKSTDLDENERFEDEDEFEDEEAETIDENSERGQDGALIEDTWYTCRYTKPHHVVRKEDFYFKAGGKPSAVCLRHQSQRAKKQANVSRIFMIIRV